MQMPQGLNGSHSGVLFPERDADLRCASMLPAGGSLSWSAPLAEKLRSGLELLRRKALVAHHQHVMLGEGAAQDGAVIGVDWLCEIRQTLNPIEPAFSKFKAHFRKAAERTIPRLLRRIGCAVRSFSPQECRNFFPACRLRSNVTGIRF
jgi:hypothetical protein